MVIASEILPTEYRILGNSRGSERKFGVVYFILVETGHHGPRRSSPNMEMLLKSTKCDISNRLPKA